MGNEIGIIIFSGLFLSLGFCFCAFFYKLGWWIINSSEKDWLIDSCEKDEKTAPEILHLVDTLTPRYKVSTRIHIGNTTIH